MESAGNAMVCPKYATYACWNSKPTTATPGSAVGRSAAGAEGSAAGAWLCAAASETAGVSSGAVASDSAAGAGSEAGLSATSVDGLSTWASGASVGAPFSAASAREERLTRENASTAAMNAASALPSNVFFASQNFSNMLIRITESSGCRYAAPPPFEASSTLVRLYVFAHAGLRRFPW